MTKNNWIIFIVFAIVSFSLMAFVYVMKVEGGGEFEDLYKSSIKYQRKMIRENPDNCTYNHFNIGVCHNNLGNKKEALKIHKMLEDLDTEFAKELAEKLYGYIYEEEETIYNVTITSPTTISPDTIIPAGSLIVLNKPPKPKSKRLWILAGCIGAFILYFLGFLTGFRFCDDSWQEKDDLRQRKEDEYNDGVAKRIREMGEAI